MSASAFISYSHADSSLVQPVVALLRGAVEVVFQDATGIKPGKKWRQEIETAVRASDLFVLFWRSHSSRSEEVEREYGMALSAAKDIVPIRLDSTAIPDQLTPFQWVDFRDLVGSTHARRLRSARAAGVRYYSVHSFCNVRPLRVGTLVLARRADYESAARSRVGRSCIEAGTRTELPGRENTSLSSINFCMHIPDWGRIRIPRPNAMAVRAESDRHGRETRGHYVARANARVA
jgi:hypothetical protein